MENNYKPHIGKNVIETLTSGMYEDARFIYREYVQNSADQIDVAVEDGILNKRSDGRIHIHIDNFTHIISIEDNATGIKAAQVRQFLGDVANSEKDLSKRKGFRGIGRLGGLGYCENLVFETSYKGEAKKSIMTLNAKLLREIISNRNDHSDAAAVISLITEIKEIPEEPEKHYFKVSLLNVTNNFILDSSKVKEYLSMVSPLPFSKEFEFRQEIIDYFKKYDRSIDEYNVSLNNKTLYKAYSKIIHDNEFVTKIVGIDFFKINDELGNLLAIGWYGLSDYMNRVLSKYVLERGLRVRKSNIQIGNEFTLNRFFTDANRTNLRLIGELHVFSSQLVPNARRDYFNDNKTLQVFEESLTKLLKAENWENRYAQNASKIHNRYSDILNFKDAIAEYEKLKDTFDSPTREKIYENKVKKARDKALKASNEIEKVKVKASKDVNIKRIYESIVNNDDLQFDPEIENKLKSKIYDPPTFAKLSDRESSLAREIISLIYESEISIDLADMLKKKIVDRYN